MLTMYRNTSHITTTSSYLMWACYVSQLLGLDDDLDSNSELTYKISRGNEEGKFSLSTNGELRLVQILDREVQGEYTLLVTATDAGNADCHIIHRAVEHKLIQHKFD